MSPDRHEPAPANGETANEEALLDAARAGDERAFELLAGLHDRRLRRVLVRVTGDLDVADDAMQEALVRAWRGLHAFRGDSNFFTWLTRIGINEAYRLTKRSALHATLPLDDAVGERIPAWGAQPDEVFRSRELLRAVDAALARLPVVYRAAVVLRDVEGLSTREAAATLGLEEAALKSRLHRGRMALRRDLDGFFGED